MKREQKMEENDGGVSSVFSSLPEDCISRIIALTSPKDAARASKVSRGFKSASESDIVWERFLPADWKEIISRSDNPPVNYATKKELFLMLCPSPFRCGERSFWLSKSSGGKCYMLHARGLSTVWKVTPRRRTWSSIEEPMEVAGLRDVCWLDIRCKMQAKMLSLETTYAAYLVFKIAEDSHGASVRYTEAISSITHMSASNNLIQRESTLIYWSPSVAGIGSDMSASNNLLTIESLSSVAQEKGRQSRVPQLRLDGWMEILLGEFYNDEGEGDFYIKFWETKILNGKTKTKLSVVGIELRPKE